MFRRVSVGAFIQSMQFAIRTVAEIPRLSKQFSLRERLCVLQKEARESRQE